ncbi:hypothetical protein EDD15DRAFT_2316468 [Pisolithus albus]|nr:hypothetical protein EDD15DRAFT_2316468 [Pisolithus albus]
MQATRNMRLGWIILRLYCIWTCTCVSSTLWTSTSVSDSDPVQRALSGVYPPSQGRPFIPHAEKDWDGYGARWVLAKLSHGGELLDS